MRILRTTLWSLILVAAALTAPSLVGPATTAHPPPKPEHGVNETTYYTLWSGDHDAFENESVYRNRTGDSRSAIAQLANGTDVPLDSPPEVVEQWNHADLGDFPDTDWNVSIHPTDARLTDGTFLKDAYVAVFSVQPSTRARLSPDDQPLYVAPNGSVLATIDYRIEVPPTVVAADQRTSWHLDAHEITETRLLVNGTTETIGQGTHTPTLAYDSLDSYPGERHTLTVEADIEVSLERHTETCSGFDANGTCTDWTLSTESVSESLTVSDDLKVTEYDLSISGFSAKYPNGDLGLVVFKNHPWLGHSVPGGRVRGVWRFYTARDPDWDSLSQRTESGSREIHSPLHPLQTYAYPIETGPTASPRTNVTILETYGDTTDPPSLPETINLDVLTEPYTASYGIVTRTTTSNHSLTGITATGLVQGAHAQASEDEFVEVSINQSTLTITIENESEDTVIVRLKLEDAESGEPISTTGRRGYVLLDGRRVNTSTDGAVQVELPQPVDGISARYVPGPWWDYQQAYVGDSDVAYVGGTVDDLLATLYRISIPVSTLLLGIFLIDRITGWRIWPPWRRL